MLRKWSWMVLWRPTSLSRTDTQKRWGLECKSRKSRDTLSNSHVWPWRTKGRRAKANRVLPRKCTNHKKQPLPIAKTLHMDITRWSISKSDWLYWKRSVFIPIPKKGSNYCRIALISHASKVMLKILQSRLQQYMNRELPVVQAGFRNGRGTRDQIANIHWIIEKSKRVPQKSVFLLYWLCQSLWLCGSQ